MDICRKSVSGSQSVQSLSRVRLFVAPWIAARQAFLSITNSQSLLKLTSIESVMPSSHLILCCPLLLLPSIFPSIRVFSNKSVLCMRWPKYWSFSFTISPSDEHSGLISFRMDWLDLLAVQGTLKSLFQHHSSKASILQDINVPRRRNSKQDAPRREARVQTFREKARQYGLAPFCSPAGVLQGLGAVCLRAPTLPLWGLASSFVKWQGLSRFKVQGEHNTGVCSRATVMSMSPPLIPKCPLLLPKSLSPFQPRACPPPPDSPRSPSQAKADPPLDHLQ